MPPTIPLPFRAGYGIADADDFVESLLTFITSTELFQNLCGGVHILDFLTQEPDLYSTILPEEWRTWFQYHEISDVLDLLMREESINIESTKNSVPNVPSTDSAHDLTWRDGPIPPSSLLDYILSIRKHALNRSSPSSGSMQKQELLETSHSLPRHVSVGMKPKKIHEVENFAKYINDLCADTDQSEPHQITHIVDFGSGQNYLGRALASPPYSNDVIALESKLHNIDGAKKMDVTAKLAEKEKIMRNKRRYRQGLPDQVQMPLVTGDMDRSNHSPIQGDAPSIDTRKSPGEHGSIRYIETLIDDGDLSDVIAQIKSPPSSLGAFCTPDPQVIVISLHSCGNLLHHGLRSLVLNPAVKVVAMVGCCYNLVTERLGPPTYKLPSLRNVNMRLEQTSSACDPHGFPMSKKLELFQHQRGNGIRLNITARMMAVQAPENWTENECDSFFTRHFYRALLQRIFLDRGVLKALVDGEAKGTSPEDWSGVGPALCIGSLRKACYKSFSAYVKGAIAKLVDDPQHGLVISRLMGGLTNEEIDKYEAKFQHKKKELSIIWSLMAFSASVVETTMVVDRWLYLKEQKEVKDCWVETVFDYKQSPRNLVVVGIKS